MALKNDPPTTGHSYDGIEEFDNPLPRWWLWTFYLGIAFAVIYWVFYPSMFGPGYLKWSQYKDYNQEMAAAKILYPVKEVNIQDYIGKPEIIAEGKLVFAQNCAACHGAEAKGLVGPNLTDSTWLHGGKPEEIQKTITEGVTVKGMPSWGPVLGTEKVASVAAYIYSLSNK